MQRNCRGHFLQIDSRHLYDDGTSIERSIIFQTDKDTNDIIVSEDDEKK